MINLLVVAAPAVQKAIGAEGEDWGTDIEHLKNVHLTNGETNPLGRRLLRRMKHNRIVRLSWKNSEGEEENGWRQTGAQEKKGRSTREVDSHLQSRLDPRSPPLLLPWQPDRRLGGGGRNEFLSSDRCRRRIPAALSFAFNDLPLTEPD